MKRTQKKDLSPAEKLRMFHELRPACYMFEEIQELRKRAGLPHGRKATEGSLQNNGIKGIIPNVRGLHTKFPFFRQLYDRDAVEASIRRALSWDKYKNGPCHRRVAVPPPGWQLLSVIARENNLSLERLRSWAYRFTLPAYMVGSKLYADPAVAVRLSAWRSPSHTRRLTSQGYYKFLKSRQYLAPPYPQEFADFVGFSRSMIYAPTLIHY